MSRKIVPLLFVFLALAVCFSSTGCKKSDDDPIIIIQPDVGGPHYYCASMYGDFLDVQLNETSALYSYRKLAGPTPLGVGQGAITPATGLGTHAYYDADPDDSTMWALNPGHFLAIGGDDFNMLGVPVVSGQYTVASITGMYNVLSMDYDRGDDSVTSDYGTLQINADNTWKLWWTVDGSTAPATSDGEGSWADGGDGLISITDNTMGKIGRMAICPSANGNILVMYYNIYHPVYGSMYGLIVGLPQVSVSSGDFDGTYDAINSNDDIFDQISVSGATVTTGGGPFTLTFNSPWTGMMQGPGGEYIIASQDGLIVVVSYYGGVTDDDITICVIE